MNIELLYSVAKDYVVIKNAVDMTNLELLNKRNYKSIDLFVVNDSIKENYIQKK